MLRTRSRRRKNEDKMDEDSEDGEEVEVKYQNPILAFLPATTIGA
jgi:hypothetical protein